ncbi:MAG TPA: recombinase family protein [Acetobacteraceae bacterium]|jgi:DNA invertase Pin-like site-specific DNA recombinase
MAHGKFAAYYRVSTARQGRSGLGLEAQRAAVRSYLNGGNWTLLSEHTEVESGKVDARPELAQALETCRLTGATLVIAKLDRLSRDAAFLLNLEKAGVEFVAADMPTANRLTVRLMSVIAQEEREMIARRTKEALTAAKARGVKLGGRRPTLRDGSANDHVVDHRLGTAAQQQRAAEYAAMVGPIISGMREAKDGKKGASLRKIADAMAQRGIRAPRGGNWTADTVRQVLLRHSTAA